MRVILTARGTVGTGAVPGPTIPSCTSAEAVSRLHKRRSAGALELGPARAILAALADLADYSWLKPLLPKLQVPATAQDAAAQMRMHDEELDDMLHTTVSPIGQQNGEARAGRAPACRSRKRARRCWRGCGRW